MKMIVSNGEQAYISIENVPGFRACDIVGESASDGNSSCNFSNNIVFGSTDFVEGITKSGLKDEIVSSFWG